MPYTSLDPIWLSYISALALSFALPLVLIGYIWPRHRAPGAKPLIGILAAVMLWSFGYIIGFINNHMAGKLIALNISYIGIVTLPVLAFIFALQFTNSDRWLTPRKILLFFIVPLITVVLLWTGKYHNLMLYDLHLTIDGPFMLVASQYGLWFWVFVTYSYVLLFAGTLVLVHRLFSPPRLFQDQAVYLMIAVAVPAIANIEYLFPFLPIPQADWTPAAFAISAICLTFAISRHGLLDVLPVARESAIELMNEGFAVVDDKGRIVDVNKAMCDITGLKQSDLHGQPLPALIVNQLNAGGDYLNLREEHIEIELDQKDGLHCYSTHVSLLQSRAGTRSHVLILYDITERKKNEEAIKQIAYYDPLTGLPNRSLFSDRAGIALAEAGRYKRKLAIMIVDLDRFKAVNDTFGHDAGDQVLQDIAARLTHAVRKVDTVSRLGGDEFLVLLPEIADEEIVDRIAHRIIREVATPFNFNANDIHLSISLGISLYPEDSQDLNSLVKYADTAMYYVKQTGRNGYARYSENMKTGKPTSPPA
ncbi:MAG: histidine kinase N-terminal 7TM domain-containing protein [Dehalococcoidia bacterium]|jgi:diguanylate cyclase (GGDEF)-like protein/PAS domain S-box-containing protein